MRMGQWDRRTGGKEDRSGGKDGYLKVVYKFTEMGWQAAFIQAAAGSAWLHEPEFNSIQVRTFLLCSYCAICCTAAPPAVRFKQLQQTSASCGKCVCPLVVLLCCDQISSKYCLWFKQKRRRTLSCLSLELQFNFNLELKCCTVALLSMEKTRNLKQK